MVLQHQFFDEFVRAPEDVLSLDAFLDEVISIHTQTQRKINHVLILCIYRSFKRDTRLEKIS
jgi:hypothetical protein